MFREFRFNVTGLVGGGSNSISISFMSVIEYANNQQNAYP